MKQESLPPDNFALIVTLFEASLVLVALGLGWLFSYQPAATFRPDIADAGWGVAATVPALALFGICYVLPWGPFVRLARLLDERIVPMFARCRVIELASISIVAGIGEELLFRGLIQGGIAEAVGGTDGIWIGLVVGSLVFGLTHAVSPMYALLTTLIGFYLGWLWISTGNLICPMMTHAVYDFVAMVYLVKVRRRGSEDTNCDDYSD